MARLVLISIAVLGTACMGWAAPLPCSNTTDYADYVAGGFSCTVNSLLFSAFNLGNGSNLTANQVTVATVANGLTFSFNLTTTSANVSEQNLNIGFEVETPEPGFGSAGLAFVGAGTEPGVTAMVTENFPGGPLVVFQKTPGADNTMTQTSAQVGLMNPESLTVTESATVSTIMTGAARTASISSMTDTFNPAPEPGTLALFALGALGLAGVGRLRSRRGTR
jgi:hypothetical protein